VPQPQRKHPGERKRQKNNKIASGGVGEAGVGLKGEKQVGRGRTGTKRETKDNKISGKEVGND